MKILRWTISVVIVLVITVAGLFAYFLYAPIPKLPSLSGQYEEHILEIQSRDRTFSSYRPKGMPGSSPVIFVLHGSKGTGEQIRRSVAYEFDLLADKYGFLVVYPDGYQNHWNDCRSSADYAANTENVDDPAFVASMIEFFTLKHGIDSEQVYVTGHSNGGHMAYRLALESTDMIAGIAPVGANLPVKSNLDCEESGEAISVAIFNGTNDPINPYEGGLVSLFGDTSRGAVRSSMDSALYWANLASVAAPAISMPQVDDDGDHSTVVDQQRWPAENGVEVRLYTLRGSGHVFPSKLARFPRIFGGDAGDISGPSEVVKFFLDLSGN